MKGHAKIELIEVATGKKKVVEHDNMLTKAISEYVKPIALTGYTPLLDCKTKGQFNVLFGGLFLFDGAIEENADITYPPKGVHCTGRGSNISYGGEDTNLGSFNSNESGFDENGNYKMVWDFNTSQANGTIAALSLTSLLGGRSGLGSPAYDSAINSSTAQTLYSTDYGFYQKVKDATISDKIAFAIGDCLYFLLYYNVYYSSSEADLYMKNSGTLSFLKVKMPVDNIVFSNNKSNEPMRYERVDISIPSKIMNQITDNNGIIGGICLDGRYMYVMLTTAHKYIAKNEEINLLKIDTQNNFSAECVSFINTTNEVLFRSYLSSNNKIPDYGGEWFVADGYYICINQDRDKLYRIKIADSTDVAAIDMSLAKGWDKNTQKRFVGKITDAHVLLKNYGNSYIIDLDEWTCKCSLFNSFGTEYLTTVTADKSKFIISMRNGYSPMLVIVQNPFYIATINNLSEPVTKTSAHTMKVTYTLSEG